MAASQLTPKQQRFVEEYIVDLNATAAYERAGYAAKGAAARSGAARLLTNANIQSAIQEVRGAVSERTQITADRVLQELALIGFLDPADLAAIGSASGPEIIPELPEHVRRAIVGWSWDKAGNFTLKLAPKTTALELLGKHLGMFAERRLDLDVTSLSTEALERIANGEDPLRVLLSSGKSGD